MNEQRWWKEAIIYQIYPRSFYDSDNDGTGDIRGIIEKLDYLENLGIDAIWISPFFESPMVDNGYDVSNYYNVDPLFGTNQDMDELICEAGKRNIRLLFDLVLNHCSDQHPWFKKALADPQSKERDYFIVKKKEELTNWRSIFGGSVWSQLGESDDYYMHVFAKEQPDLNWENPALRAELYQIINYWLAKGVGGFRIDAITYIKKNQEYLNFEPDGQDGLAHVDKGSSNQAGIGAFLTEMKESTFANYDCVTVAEAVGVPLEELSLFTGDSGYFSMIFEFSYENPSMPTGGNWTDYQGWTVPQLKDLIFKAQAVSEEVGWSPTNLETHDTARSPNRYLPAEAINDTSKKMLATMYFLLRGTPFIYQGQELGMENCTIKEIDLFDDISTHDHYERALASGFDETTAFNLIQPRSRDNARTPFLWNQEKHAGFTQGTPWLPVNDYYPSVNVAVQETQADSILNFYKELIRLRKNSDYAECLVYGQIQPQYEELTNVVTYDRVTKKQRIRVMCNFQNKAETIKFDGTYQVLLTNETVEKLSSNQIRLAPYQSLVLKITN